MLLSDRAAARGIVKRDYVARCSRNTLQARTCTTPGFGLLNLELWFRMWADQSIEAALERPSHAGRPALVA